MSKFTNDKPNYGSENQTVILGRRKIPRGECCNCGNWGLQASPCRICGGEVSDGTKTGLSTLPADEIK